MKVIILGPAYPFRGGIADTNHSLAKALIENGHQVEMVTFTTQYPKIIFPGKNQLSTAPPPVNLSIKRALSSVNPLTWGSTARQIMHKKPDLVIIRFWMPYLAPSLGWVAKKLKKKVKVLALCDNVIPHEKRLGDKTFTRFFISQNHGFITLSKHVKAELETLTTKPILDLFHPINTDLPDAVPISEARKKLKLDPEKKYVLFFGLIRTYKGLDLLLRALAEEKLKALDLHLVIAGEFYEDEQKYRDLIKNLELEDKVIIHSGFVPHNEISSYICAADLLGLTYKSASQSGITQLAFKYGTPVLATDKGGIKESIKHMHNGLISNTDIKAISENIYLFFTEDLKASMSQNLLLESKKLTWRSLAEELVEFSGKIV